jgi:hypothetical protein
MQQQSINNTSTTITTMTTMKTTNQNSNNSSKNINNSSNTNNTHASQILPTTRLPNRHACHHSRSRAYRHRVHRIGTKAHATHHDPGEGRHAQGPHPSKHQQAVRGQIVGDMQPTFHRHGRQRPDRHCSTGNGWSDRVGRCG